MVKWVGAAALAATLMIGALAPTKVVQAASITPTARKPVRPMAYINRTVYPAYYGRPVVYAPAPFVPIPPLFGYGWEWW